MVTQVNSFLYNLLYFVLWLLVVTIRRHPGMTTNWIYQESMDAPRMEYYLPRTIRMPRFSKIFPTTTTTDHHHSS